MAPEFGVVIPACDEAEHIVATLRSLRDQEKSSGESWWPGGVVVVVVEGGSVDDTAAAVEDFQASPAGRDVVLLRQDERSMVTSRARGMEHLLSLSSPPRWLISCDADTTFHPRWLTAIAERLHATGADLVSCAGFFEPELWRRCPRLARRYAEEVGTIFFDPGTIDALGLHGKRTLFSEQVFLDFGRPVSDAGFAMRPQAYRAFGGFREERFNSGEREVIQAVGWPLMFRCELAGGQVAYQRAMPYHTSPRRLVYEPGALFSGASYRGTIAHAGAPMEDDYARLDAIAPTLDFGPLREYVVRDYVLQQCVTVPGRVPANRRYFGDQADAIHEAVLDWQDAHPQPDTADVFDAARSLHERFGADVLTQIATLGLGAPDPVSSPA